jgi:glycerophosphoryl diester phosphodiesterase
MKHRVTAASFTDEIIKDFRLQDDDILTAFSEAEALPLMLAVFGGDDSYEVPAPAGEFLQIPENYSLNGLDLNLVNDSNVNFLLSAFDLRVHVWTVNENEAMDRMLNVENLAGIMTDFPQMLMQKIDAKASSAE